MTINQLSQTLAKIEQTAGRNDSTAILAEVLKLLQADEVAPVMYLLQGRVAPSYVNAEFNFATQNAIKVLETINPTAKDLFNTLGDEGLVAAQVMQNNTPKDLTVLDVFTVLQQIVNTSGAGSQEKKQQIYADLLKSLDPESAKFVTRAILGKLRLGVNYKTILDALSFAVGGDKKLRPVLDQAYGARPDLGYIANLCLQTNPSELEAVLNNITVQVGSPVAAKLVEREDGPESTWARMQSSYVQPKLDGMRAQIHYSTSGVGEIFSRNMESLTHMFPEILAAVSQLGVESIILDSEVIGIDASGKFIPFQETSQRRRKHNVAQAAQDIPIQANIFDVLYLSGQDLTRLPLSERLQKLDAVLAKNNNPVLKDLETILVTKEAELTDYFFECVNKGLEGIIVKLPNSTYKPGTRNFDWIKLKANTQSNLVDTVDVVVLGYLHGKGSRAKYGFGSILCGIYNAQKDVYETVAYLGSGFTDAIAPVAKEALNKITVTEKPNNVDCDPNQYPDVWVTPQIVLEISADEITRSPTHTAAKDLQASFETQVSGKGLSLRFPRLKIWGRDKNAIQSTSGEELIRLMEIRKQRLG